MLRKHGFCRFSARAKVCCHPQLAINVRKPRRDMGVRGLGFDFGDREEGESNTSQRRKIGNLGTLSASMLVMSPVMRGAVAEAFLATMSACGKYQGTNKDILAAYGKFFGLLLQAGYDSWSDYLLDQALLGRDNSLARAVAQGGVGGAAPVLEALRHDLDVLQALAVELPELAEYIREMAPLASTDWVHVAASVSLGDVGSKQQSRLGGASPACSANLKKFSKFIASPPSTHELQQWRSDIMSHELWSEAAPLLVQYWATHGFGITSRNSALRWNKGALEEGSDPAPAMSAPSSTTSSPPVSAGTATTNLTVLEKQRAALAANTVRHSQGLKASHALVAGPSGSGKSWLLWDSTLAAGRDLGLRVVDVGADTGSVLEAARGCARYPRIRFVLVADHVDLPLRGPSVAELMAGLSSVGASGWPSNTLLYLGASANSSVSLDPVVSRFGVKLFTPTSLSKDQFAQTLQELAKVVIPKGDPVSDVPESHLSAAIAWAETNEGSLNVRGASSWLQQYLDG